MSNRKIPFGYQMAMGKIEIAASEAALVQEIFDRYVLGASYKELTDMLKKQQITYQPDKLWNKNMVARMLEDRRYIGEKGFPAVIEKETFHRADKKRGLKRCPVPKTAVQKVLHRLCAGTVTAATEPQVLALLNKLAENPERIRPQQSLSDAGGHVAEIQKKLSAVMEQQPVDEDAANRLIMQLAAVQYESLNSSEYETERLQRRFGGMIPMTELDAEVLRASVSAVHIRRGKVSLTLKNGQVIEMR